MKVKCIEKWQTFKVEETYDAIESIGAIRDSWFVFENNGSFKCQNKNGYQIFDHKTCFEIIEE